MQSNAMVKEFLRRTEKPNCEYREGVLHPKAIPTTVHGRMKWILLLILNRLGLEALPEVSAVSVPDIIADRNLESPYPTEPVMLWVEILSP